MSDKQTREQMLQQLNRQAKCQQDPLRMADAGELVERWHGTLDERAKRALTGRNIVELQEAIAARLTKTSEADVERVARALARSHGLGDHMTNLGPWMRDARTALEAMKGGA